jgi:hypothetical protein
MSRIRQILEAIEVTGVIPLWLAIELSAPGALSRTWHRTEGKQRLRWLRARPGALEPMMHEIARLVGFSDQTVQDIRSLAIDCSKGSWKRFCEPAAARFPSDTFPAQFNGWFALGAMFVGAPSTDIVAYGIDAGLSPQRVHELILAAGPPTLAETVAYAATILPMGGRP